MKLPIILAENSDITVHPTIRHAEKYLEPADIKEKSYTGYDGEGHLLNLSVVAEEKERNFLFLKQTGIHEVVKINTQPMLEDHSAELRQKLVGYLEFVYQINKRKYSREGIRKKTLNELIVEVGNYMPWPI